MHVQCAMLYITILLLKRNVNKFTFAVMKLVKFTFRKFQLCYELKTPHFHFPSVGIGCLTAESGPNIRHFLL